jgi:hypothetical protein
VGRACSGDYEPTTSAAMEFLKSEPPKDLKCRVQQAKFRVGKGKASRPFQTFYWDVERVMGIEPTYQAWEARVLPLNYTRMFA